MFRMNFISDYDEWNIIETCSRNWTELYKAAIQIYFEHESSVSVHA